MNDWRTNMKTMHKSTLKIPQDAFKSMEMWSTRVMHEKAYLLDDIDNIGTSECQVL